MLIQIEHYPRIKYFDFFSNAAHQWIEIIEVKIEGLKEYLEDAKSKGYKIIGIEQTSESTKLNEFQFPEKSVIFLGNEKEGIPVELIQLLDCCVEIPQHGIIRSLNVHVTGAIIIWEYVKQYLNYRCFVQINIISMAFLCPPMSKVDIRRPQVCC